MDPRQLQRLRRFVVAGQCSNLGHLQRPSRFFTASPLISSSLRFFSSDGSPSPVNGSHKKSSSSRPAHKKSSSVLPSGAPRAQPSSRAPRAQGGRSAASSLSSALLPAGIADQSSPSPAHPLLPATPSEDDDDEDNDDESSDHESDDDEFDDGGVASAAGKYGNGPAKAAAASASGKYGNKIIEKILERHGIDDPEMFHYLWARPLGRYRSSAGGDTPPASPRMIASRVFFSTKSPGNPGSWFFFGIFIVPCMYGGDSVGRSGAFY